MTGDYLFAVPDSWAETHSAGRHLITGRFRDGGLSGLGPTLYAFAPDADASAGSALEYTTLLEYGPVEASVDDYEFPRSIDDYNHSDDWREALWVSAGNQTAVGIIGSKALGHHWYGYHGERMRHNWVIADVPYPDFYSTDPDGKGWRSHNRTPMIIFYEPADLAPVASGTSESWQPQPYAALRMNPDHFYNQHDIRSAAFDPQAQKLYITEFSDPQTGQLVIHVWEVQTFTLGIQSAPKPTGFRLTANVPNPFNASTRIQFVLPHAAHALVTLYDINGRQVRLLADQVFPQGRSRIQLNAAGLASGVYFCRVITKFGSRTRKICLMQ
ncbi:MAG: T9SS type A sorting domain-containing protein [candidate division KSB1 bacterium]|nr:T9SS type A sorting domain-containing protein [candidate division KSB1 bacterium]